jgi:hypothetical protein
MLAARRGPFVAISQVEDRAALDQVLAARGEFVPSSKTLTDWAESNPLTLIISQRGTTHLFAAAQQGLEFIKSQASQAPGQDADTVAAGIGMYQDIVRLMAREFTQAAVALQIDPQRGLKIEKRAMISSGGKLAGLAASLPARSRPALQDLPEGPYMMAMDGPLPEFMSEEMMELSMSVMRRMAGSGGQDITDEKLQAVVRASSAVMKDVQSASMVIGVPQQAGGVYSRTVGLFKVADATRYLDAYQQAMQQMRQLFQGLKVPFMGMYELERIEVDGLQVLQVTMDMAQAVPQTPGGPDMKQLFERMFGPGGKISIYLAPADQQTVVLAYESTENLQRGLQAARAAGGGLSADEQTGKAASLLPTTAQWVGYLSPAGTIAFGQQMLGQLAPPAAGQMPEFPLSPPLGFSAQLKPGELNSHLAVPLPTMQAAVEFGTRMRNMILPPQAPPPQAVPGQLFEQREIEPPAEQDPASQR